MAESADYETIIGTVHRIIFSDPGGFHVISLKKEPFNRRVVVVGNLMGIKPGLRVKILGEWQNNKKHGKQFRAVSFSEEKPLGKEGLIKYLSGYFHGIGPTLARRIVDHFQEDTMIVLEKDIDKLQEVPGIGQEKLLKIKNEWAKKKNLAESLVFLRTVGIGPEISKRIIQEYGLGTITVIRQDPYCLIRDINGIGFQTADSIADKLSIPEKSPIRIKAAVLYELMSAEEDGNCCMALQELISRTKSRLNISIDAIKSFVSQLIDEKELVLRERYSPKKKVVFRSVVDRIEQDAVMQMTRLLSSRFSPIKLDIPKICRLFAGQTGMKPAPEQVVVLEKIKNNPVLVITGGPGTGKTTIVKMIVMAFKSKRIKLAAPTGRAAQRLSEATGRTASTIHRLLVYHPKSNQFVYNAQKPIPADLIIIDESSMLDIFLFAALLRAVPSGCRLIFIGDADQLPSVGPGKVLLDLIQSQKIEVVRLKHIFRQKQNSRIVQNAYKILKGEPLDFGVSGDGGDFFFIEKNEPDSVIDVVKKLPGRLAAYLNVDPVDDIQVLCPMYKGSLGVDHFNQILQELLNPRGQKIRMGQRDFRVGDKVMQTKNNYDLDVYNGDIGRIVSVDSPQDEVHISFGKRIVEYNVNTIHQLVLAYACSIHKSQGSEYAGVIIPLHTQHYIMLKRQLLYTAVTRGKRMVIIIGSAKALYIAIKNRQEETRCTLLTQRLVLSPKISSSK